MNANIPQQNIFTLTYKHQIEAFISSLQKGDISLSNIIQYAIVLYGQTKTGKTASSHQIVGNPLKGVKKDGEIMVEPTTDRNRKARIGNEMTS